jgi:hypothetical protein
MILSLKNLNVSQKSWQKKFLSCQEQATLIVKFQGIATSM